jgi:eukaryotic-like serine/threonine-protein kinase
LLTSGASFGRYRIERLIGAGGMGEVYEAEDVESGRRLAVKVLGRGLTDDRDRLRFLREGRLAASINHPNTVYVFGTEEIAGTPVIAMELVTGGTLKDRVATHGPLPPKEAVDAVLQVTAGLEAAEAVGVLHRDMKPSNCFVDADGTVKVGDFGLSISTVARAATEITVMGDQTLSGTFVGTPAFASPEQLRGDRLDVRSDIYAVCATLYYLLTGRAPFEESNLFKLVTMVAQEPPASVHDVRGDVPHGLANVVARGLSKRPERRFASYQALCAALAPYRTDAVAPTTLGLRFLAGAVDTVCLRIISGILSLTLPEAMTANRGPADVRPFLVVLVYFGVPESLWGASLGKAICGLRVVDVEGQPAQARFVMLRAALYSASERTPNLIWYVVQRLRTLPTDALALAELHGSVLTIAEIVTRVMLFISARRSNGFAGIHDLITRTRVVRQSITRAHHVAGSPLPAPPAQGPSAAATIGPYEIVADLGGGLRRGYDATLSRFVWIRTTHQDSGADLRRRRLSRRTRLRWLAGGAWSEGHWDAFEEPPGEPLTRLTAAQPWSLVRESLHDVASELAHGLEDGSLPPLTIDRIWLASSGRAWVLDFPGPGTASHRDQTVEANAPDIVSAQRFLDTVAQRMLCDPAANKPVLPLPAAEALQRIATGALASVGDLHSIASQLVRGPAFVTRRRRTFSWRCADCRRCR